MRQQVDRECVFPDVDLRDAANPFDQRPHHFFARRVAQRVHHPAVTVSPFLGQGDFSVSLIEMSPHRHQFDDPGRGFADDGFDDRPIA